MSEVKNTSVQTTGKDTVEIIPLGSDQAIKLSVDIVRNMVAVPTRTGQLPSKNDCLKFIALCRAKHLNPFEGDCFMLGYDDQKRGPTFSQITAYQVFLKRAEASPQFDGMESGVVVETDGTESRREGDRVRKGEVLLGGWARVYRRDRSKPIYKELDLSVFSTGQSRWVKDPAGMIVKCAEADALRTAFPTHLGGLYTADERPLRVDVDMQPEPLVLTVPKDDEPAGDDSNTELAPAKTEAKAEQSPQAELEAVITEAGYTFADFLKVAPNLIADADSIGSFGDVPAKDAARLLRSKVGLLGQIKKVKE